MKTPSINMDFKTEKVDRDDGLNEEKIVETGKEEHPLRHAVGMPLFASEEEKRQWFASQTSRQENADLQEKHKEGRSGKERLVDSLEKKLLGYLMIFKGNRPSIKMFADVYLNQKFDEPGAVVKTDISEDARVISVNINSPEHGKIEFEVKLP
jgi:hypothetical protein